MVSTMNLTEFVAFFPDGKTLASTTLDDTVTLWELTADKSHLAMRKTR